MNQSTNFYRASARQVMYGYLIIVMLSSCVALCHADDMSLYCEKSDIRSIDDGDTLTYAEERQVSDLVSIGDGIENIIRDDDSSLIYGPDASPSVRKTDKVYQILVGDDIISESVIYSDIIKDLRTMWTLPRSITYFEDGSYRDYDTGMNGCLITGICS